MGCCFSNPIEEPTIPQPTLSVYSSASSTYANTNYPSLVPGSGQAYVAQPYVQQYASTQQYSQPYSQPVQQYQVPIGMQPQPINLSQIQYQPYATNPYPTAPYPTAPYPNASQMPPRTYSQDPSNVI
jgi:hypothetical protein